MASLLLLKKVLEMLGDDPQSILETARVAARFAKVPSEALTEGTLRIALESDDLNEPIQLVLSRAIAKWDYLDRADWTAGTSRNTSARRDLIMRLLEMPEDLAAIYSRRFPPVSVEQPLVIASEHEPWYPDGSCGNFYWDAYQSYLRDVLHWHQDSINVLADSTTSILERLACPWQSKAFQSKGLVVGYVQSGKTASFTGVIARAVDAGYRLIIVLAGLLDVLRNQTQRRIDRELVGKELLALAPGGNEYASDQEWFSFLEHGGLPSTFNAPDWHRLTGPTHDYIKLGKGVDALDIERRNPALPVFAQENLRHARARLLVVKKNPRVLERIIDDLSALKRTSLAHVPALIIDDESDQASIDTSRPAADAQHRRTATNRSIRQLLKLLPRAQYIGYTATPFANVLVNPSDDEDIFPRDYVIALPRPIGYMGVNDFFDMGDSRATPPAMSNEAAYVRSVIGGNDKPENLQAAIECFILSGAIKLFRAAERPALLGGFRHHTMLVHSSVRKLVHTADAEFVLEQYRRVVGRPELMWRRLAKRFTDDFEKVSAARGKGQPFPEGFGDLRGCIVDCLARLESGQLVRIVNGDNRDDAPEFDQGPVWAILVGGAKLSRGYTIEGLTISYYRRTTSTADTLMQMGRWFGFRPGYGDLVRLFLGRAEPLDKRGKRTLDLLEAFKATCQDELEFRAEIKRYAKVDGQRPLRPVDLTPLVPSHLLRPTAANKMRYARIRMMNFGGRWSEKTLAPEGMEAIRHNQKLTRDLLMAAGLGKANLSAIVGGESLAFTAWVGSASVDATLSFLRRYRWADGTFGVMQRELEFMSNKSGTADPEIDATLIVVPQLKAEADGVWSAAGIDFTVKRRTRVGEGGRYKAFSEPDHRHLVAFLCGVEKGVATGATAKLVRRRQAGLIVYPVKERGAKVVSIGFALLFPPNGTKAAIRWAVDSPGDQAEADTA